MHNKFFVFLLLCFIAVCCGVYISLPRAEFSIGSFTPYAQVQVTPEVQEVQKNRIRFVGDIMLARNVENLMRAYGSAYPFSALPVHPEDAYLVGNFEASIPVLHVPTKSMTFSFSVDPQYLTGLQEYGFTHMGLANNHAYDFGVENYAHTVQMLQNIKLTPFGDPGELSATSSVTYIETASTTIALVAVYAVQESPAFAEIVSVFKEANKLSEKQIVYVHWGNEYEPVHSASQERLAHALIDAGADLIVGHHPHVIQDVGMYKNAPIFYSIGNFVFDQYFSEEVQEGLLLELVDAETMQIDVHVVTSIGSRSAPRVATAYEKEVALEKLAKVSDEMLQEMIKKGSIKLDL